ncbi:MAG: FliA/WhiG family RNA polymerase sigma factor [Planctomycetota bacterium]|nr:FliA/WhiG family RNA polymerase sigma factor [Planctomycetota bacterium]
MRRASRGTPESLWGKFLNTRRRMYKDELVLHYLPLVRMVADRLSLRLPRSVEHDDLMSAGIFGLFKSVEAFDPDKNARFETYCRLRVRGAMIDFLRQVDWIPREARNRGTRLHEAIADLRDKLGRDPTDLELARNLKLSLDTLRSALSELHFSSMVPFPDHGDGESSDDRPDFLGEQPEPSDILHKRETYELVRRELTAVERRLVDGYYFKGLTLKDIGKKEGISESRVCQIHGRMLDRLAERLENQA